jgi:hypothetical protein
LRGLGEQSDKRTGLEQGRFGHLSRSLCRRCHTVSLSRSQGLGRKIMVEYCTKNGQALRSEPRIDTRRHLGYPSGTLELGEVSGTSQYSRSVFGERLEDFGTTTVWSTLVCTESDFSRERDRLAEMAANLKTMAAAIMEMAHTAAQKVVQDRLMAARFTIEGVRTRGTCWNSVSFDWRTPADINVNVWSWTSGSTQPGSRRGNGGHGRSSGPCEAEVKNFGPRCEPRPSRWADSHSCCLLEPETD